MGYFGDYFGAATEEGTSAVSTDFDAVDLIEKCKLFAMRPDNDQMMSDKKWCQLLSMAQQHWFPILVTHVPESQYGAPVALTSAADRKTATFPDGVVPIGRVEIYDGINGRRLIPGGYDDPTADFVIEGSRIRAPMDRTLGVTGLIYARYSDAGDLTIRTEAVADEVGLLPREPVLLPKRARVLLVYHAMGLYASLGGYQDPTYWEHLEIKAAHDDPSTGKLGIITELKMQYADQSAGGAPWVPWYKSSDLGNLRWRIT